LEEARNMYTAHKNGSTNTFDNHVSKSIELPNYIDSTLFNGLQYFMSDEEQIFVEALMTSGDASKLAQAAQILDGVADICRQGGVRNSSIYTRPTNTGNTQPPQPSHSRTSRSRRQYTGTISRNKSGIAVERALAMGRSEKERKTQARQEKIELFNKRHPLPVRMPNYMVLTSANFRNIAPTHRNFPLQFVDDEWDGSIADAFARVNISRNSTVTKKLLTNIEGVNNVLNAGESQEFSDDATSTISKPINRVLITKVKGEAGKQGAQSGDVVTHLNGELFEGNAKDLRSMIIEFSELSKNGDLTFVLNAEQSVAEALRLRSVALSLAIKET